MPLSDPKVHFFLISILLYEPNLHAYLSHLDPQNPLLNHKDGTQSGFSAMQLRPTTSPEACTKTEPYVTQAVHDPIPHLDQGYMVVSPSAIWRHTHFAWQPPFIILP